MAEDGIGGGEGDRREEVVVALQQDAVGLSAQHEVAALADEVRHGCSLGKNVYRVGIGAHAHGLHGGAVHVNAAGCGGCGEHGLVGYGRHSAVGLPVEDARTGLVLMLINP